MGLKTLISNLEAGSPFGAGFPNHSTPEAYNYGESTSIFDTNLFISYNSINFLTLSSKCFLYRYASIWGLYSIFRYVNKVFVLFILIFVWE